MKNKSKAMTSIVQFTTLAHTQFGNTVKQFRSDNCKEFLMNDYFNHKGIIHQKNFIETPQQNVVA